MIPKFRAWRKNVSKMVNVSSLFWETTDEEEKLSANWWYTTRNSFISSGNDVSEDFILMQSTGIFDENGVEIFEGDIVQTTRFVGRADWKGGFYEYDKDYRGIVKMLEGCWLIDTGTDSINLWSEIEENIIIGNIYANPELVEEKNV